MTGLPQAIFDLCGSGPVLPARRQRALGQAGSEQAERRRRHADHLSRVVEGEIIPRLMLAHQTSLVDWEPLPDNEISIGPEFIEKFALVSLNPEPGNLQAIVGALLRNGVRLEAIYLDLLAPTARLLGKFWEEDRISFADVTIALGRLQHLLREFSIQGGPIEGHHSGAVKSALFAPAPGEQHTFGLGIVEEFFRRAGWRTWAEPGGAVHDVCATAAAQKFDVVGLSISCAENLDLLRQSVMSIREESRNRDIAVLVGGRLLVECPDIAAQVGADYAASDAPEAVRMAETAVKRLERH